MVNEYFFHKLKNIPENYNITYIFNARFVLGNDMKWKRIY